MIEERFGFVCDCGCAVFQLTTPDEITCDDCGMTLPDIIWVVVCNGEQVEEKVIYIGG